MFECDYIKQKSATEKCIIIVFIRTDLFLQFSRFLAGINPDEKMFMNFQWSGSSLIEVYFKDFFMASVKRNYNNSRKDASKREKEVSFNGIKREQ